MFHSKRTPLIAATAAALSACAVTVAGSAFGNGAHASRADQVEVAALRACLVDHGAAAPAGDGRVLKQWLAGDRTAAEKDAMRACGLDVPSQKVGAGPGEPALLRSCLADHGVTVPAGDGGALKRWIIGDHSAAETDALKACGVGPVTKEPAPCAAGKPALPDKPAVSAPPTTRSE
jgi:hypothetical protein